MNIFIICTPVRNTVHIAINTRHITKMLEEEGGTTFIMMDDGSNVTVKESFRHIIDVIRKGNE